MSVDHISEKSWNIIHPIIQKDSCKPIFKSGVKYLRFQHASQHKSIPSLIHQRIAFEGTYLETACQRMCGEQVDIKQYYEMPSRAIFLAENHLSDINFYKELFEKKYGSSNPRQVTPQAVYAFLEKITRVLRADPTGFKLVDLIAKSTFVPEFDPISADYIKQISLYGAERYKQIYRKTSLPNP